MAQNKPLREAIKSSQSRMDIFGDEDHTIVGKWDYGVSISGESFDSKGIGIGISKGSERNEIQIH